MPLLRAVLDSLLPPGPLWTPEEGADLDLLLGGIGDCIEPVKADMSNLAYVRNALRTPVLSDLEREYGVIPRPGASESTRRAHLNAVQLAATVDGGLDTLQEVLQAAGFAVQVHANDPPVDPASFIFYAPGAMFGNTASSFGASAFGGRRGELLVNGPLRDAAYEIPADEGYWPLFFFVGGEATRNADGELTSITDARIPAARRSEFKTLILRCKPLHAWAGLRIEYV